MLYRRALLKIGLPLVGVLFFAQTTHAATDSLELIQAKKELRVGLDPGFFPFEMKTPNGEMVGFDIDMINAFAESIGAKATFIDTRWEGIIPALVARKFDVIVSGMTITEERKKTLLFSEPYYQAGLVAMVSSKKKEKIKTATDLNHPSVSIAVKVGTTGDIFATKAYPKARLRKLDSQSDCANAVALGKVDAFIYDKPFLQLFASKFSDKAYVLNEGLTVEEFGVAARKSDKKLISSFNSFLKKWKDNGGYAKSHKIHFVEMPWAASMPLFK
jgi:polar amino acid transport system substrate-binding protein